MSRRGPLTYRFRDRKDWLKRTHLSNSNTTLSEMAGHLFIHSVQELKYFSTEDIIPVHDEKSTGKLVPEQMELLLWFHSGVPKRHKHRTYSSNGTWNMSVIMRSVSCFQRHQREGISTTVLEKDEKTSQLDVFFDETEQSGSSQEHCSDTWR